MLRIRHKQYAGTLRWIVPGPQGRVAVSTSPLGASDFVHRPLPEGTCQARRRVSVYIFSWRRVAGRGVVIIAVRAFFLFRSGSSAWALAAVRRGSLQVGRGAAAAPVVAGARGARLLPPSSGQPCCLAGAARIAPRRLQRVLLLRATAFGVAEHLERSRRAFSWRPPAA
ncbi:unnamed protein product [Prorocentrum cordatum]|uniref:Uncharacterized protein n=1 Tax=Prorocentrum cordatum TaxID=2364126 RepID=A0ABN9Q052_9DINO|nr:unnamed protein product [Polarella glacialis]